MTRLRRKLQSVSNIIVSIIKNVKDPYFLRLDRQINKFKDAGLEADRDKLSKVLNSSLDSAGLPFYDEDNGMYSEHLLIFAALSIHSSFKPKNILEIGTHDGRCACTLAQLFPESAITTLDLRDDDPVFENTYGRNDCEAKKKFVSERNRRILQFKNLEFVQLNSLNLFRWTDKKFDLIWIDGAHGYPVVCCDITNSLRLLEHDGIVMCDDVWTKRKENDAMYSSTATWQTLQAFEQAGLLTNTLLRKRIGFRHLSDEKFVSFSKLLIS